MPTYKFQNKKTGQVTEEFMSISALDPFLQENPDLEQLVNGFPGIGYNTVTSKPADGFRDILRSIKKANSKGITKSTINTF